MKYRKTEVRVGEEKFESYLADSFLKRFWGLSLKKKGKMLFVLPWDTKAGIDMMLLSRPLHLYFIDSEKKVVDIKKAEPWTWNPKTWRIYRPETRHRYLLESFEKLDIQEGDKLGFEI